MDRNRSEIPMVSYSVPESSSTEGAYLVWDSEVVITDTEEREICNEVFLDGEVEIMVECEAS